jgi:hypothetical protein
MEIWFRHATTEARALMPAQVMVGGAVAPPAVTPESRVRACPSGGSSGYGSLSQKDSPADRHLEP